MDLILNNPDTNAHKPQNTDIITKFIIQFSVIDLENILKPMMPIINTTMESSNLVFILKLNIL
jgi:hypothetical protein